MIHEHAQPTEHQEQRTLIEWWGLECRRWKLPDFALFAVPNGGARYLATAGRMKAEGVRKGAPDLVLAAARGGFHGAYLEMKRERNAALSPAQAAFGEYLRGAGYAYTVAHGFDAARAWILDYLDEGP